MKDEEKKTEISHLKSEKHNLRLHPQEAVTDD